jgi:hypothetical protein
MSYVVVKPLVIAKQEDGSFVHVYEGGLLPEGTDSDQVEQLVADEMVEKVGKPQASPAAKEKPVDEKPAGNASHDEWVTYAVSQGVDQDEAVAKSRDELRDLFK